MDPQPAFTFQDLFTFVIGDMAKAIAEREGEPREQQFARSQAAVHMILGFLPRDVIEAMLAGHCVMLHEVMTAKARTSLRGDTDPSRRGPRSNIVGLNKAFNDNLDRLERYQQRPAEGTRDAPETQSPTAPAPPPTATTEPRQPPPVAPRLNRAARRQAARAESRAAATASRAAPNPAGVMPPPAAQTKPGTVLPEVGLYSPSPEAMAACNANPEAMAALRSGDASGFARAMGIAHPCEGFLAAANSEGSPFDKHASGPWPTGAIAPAQKA